MRSASPADAGTGSTTVRDAASVAFTVDADFKGDWNEPFSTSTPFAGANDDNGRFAGAGRTARRRSRRRYRDRGSPSATGDGRPA